MVLIQFHLRIHELKIWVYSKQNLTCINASLYILNLFLNSPFMHIFASVWCRLCFLLLYFQGVYQNNWDRAHRVGLWPYFLPYSLHIQGDPKKRLWSSLQPKLPHKLLFLIVISFLIPKNSKLLLTNLFLQTTENVLKVSKKYQKARSE